MDGYKNEYGVMIEMDVQCTIDTQYLRCEIHDEKKRYFCKVSPL